MMEEIIIGPVGAARMQYFKKMMKSQGYPDPWEQRTRAAAKPCESVD